MTTSSRRGTTIGCKNVGTVQTFGISWWTSHYSYERRRFPHSPLPPSFRVWPTLRRGRGEGGGGRVGGGGYSTRSWGIPKFRVKDCAKHAFRLIAELCDCSSEKFPDLSPGVRLLCCAFRFRSWVAQCKYYRPVVQGTHSLHNFLSESSSDCGDTCNHNVHRVAAGSTVSLLDPRPHSPITLVQVRIQ